MTRVRNRAHLRIVQIAALAVIALEPVDAAAESAKLAPKQPVALFVDVSEEQVPAAAGAFKARQFDLNGLPVLVGSGPTNDLGLQAGHSVVLGAGFSIDGAASLSRSVAPGAAFSPAHGTSAMAAGATMHFQQGGWDIALFPEVSTAGLDASRMPNYVLGGSVARKGRGWAMQATSHYERRVTDTLAGEAGTSAQGRFGLSGLPLLGAQLDLGYDYDWAQPQSGTVTLSHGPAVALDLGLSDTLKCRVGYRYAFAGDASNVGPDFAWLGGGSQDVTIGLDWDLAAQGVRGTTFTAGFAYHQDFFDAASQGDGSGGINLAMAF